MSDPRICKEPVDVLDAAARIIQIDLAVAIPIKAAFHDNLIVVNGQLLVRVVKDKNDLGNTECAACSRAGEDDVFGTQSTQHTDVLFTENPANGIRDIALTAPIRSHDSSNPLIELDDNPLGK